MTSTANRSPKMKLKLTWLVVLAAMALTQASAQVLASGEVKKLAPGTYYFAGQSAMVQTRNTAALKNSAGKFVLAGLVDTSGYSTAIAEKYQGFLITETRLTFGESKLEPGEYGFGFKDGKFIVMNVASTDLLSVASEMDDKLKHPVPLKIEKASADYRLYNGRKFVVIKAD